MWLALVDNSICTHTNAPLADLTYLRKNSTVIPSGLVGLEACMTNERRHISILSFPSHPSFCLRVSQVFELGGIFLPLMVVPHAFHRKASFLPPRGVMSATERCYRHLNEDAPDFEMVAWVTAEGRSPFLRIARVSLSSLLLLFFRDPNATSLYPFPYPSPFPVLLSAVSSTESNPSHGDADISQETHNNNSNNNNE